MNNDQTITASAPGKLMLLGEHAVVYGQPCLVTAVDQRVEVTIAQNEQLELVAPHVKDTRFVSTAVDLFLKRYHVGNHFQLTTKGMANYGLGSSSAVTVAALKALSSYFNISLTEQALFDLAYEVVLAVQGLGSGFDIGAAVYGRTLYFKSGGQTIEPLNITTLPLIIGYSGVKADTVTLINQVKEKIQGEPKKGERIIEAIGKLVDEAKEQILKGDWERVGKLMDFNQEYLRDMGVSTEKLESMTSAAKKAGAYGAKLSGAGGGDCMIAIAPEEKRKGIIEAISYAGGQIIDIPVHAEGVKLLKSKNFL